MRGILHLVAHFAVPAGIAVGLTKRLKPPRKWSYYWIIMISTMAIDLDHLLATPIYDPNRCSIGFHPLHTTWAIVVYIILLFPEKTRIVALGLVIHIALDVIDCAMI